MRYLKTYKLFESKRDIQDRISVINDFLSELIDDGYNIKYDSSYQNGTRIIVDITKYDDVNNKFYWSDIKDDILRLIDLCNDNGLIFRHMGYNSGRNVFGDKVKTFDTDEELYRVNLGFDINYDSKKYFHLDRKSVENYLYSLRNIEVSNVESVRVEPGNLFVNVDGKEHEIVGVVNLTIRGVANVGFKWEDIRGELIKIQDTLNKMTNNSYVLRIGRTKDTLSHLVVTRELDSNTVENLDSELTNTRIFNMEVIIRHK